MSNFPFKTEIPWVTKVKGSRYGTDHTYIKAAEWFAEVGGLVADWGGGRGHFLQHLPVNCAYKLIDGTFQEIPELRLCDIYEIADLKTYRGKSKNILLRHVLEMTYDWREVLENAVECFEKRMVVITFTPPKNITYVHTHHLTWPCHHFNHDEDLIPRMMPYIKKIEAVRTTQPERVYYLEKP